jgi:hypothetical protein
MGWDVGWNLLLVLLLLAGARVGAIFVVRVLKRYISIEFGLCELTGKLTYGPAGSFLEYCFS